MKQFAIGLLILANLSVMLLVFGALNQSRAQQLSVSDLTYGKIDADGDGEYTYGDDHVVEWILENSPHHIDQALKSARINGDGGVDLSVYLLSVQDEKRPRSLQE